ncbi:DUF445 domain-containing protein [Oxalobacteraceae bacterium R-40]|uniref:DUF445 domain-containing protein n=1 Tax=Keguizhuia sedimenti TaxID=3064264 RepID=A0ABU1BQA6_9BURK|nr:DUF445 domain-containing protein [Oxalobacteraceae bacterium R-40]
MPEEEQSRQLKRIRGIATGLLALMAMVFVVSKLLQPNYPYLSFVRAFAEAAMVGALADWFAVTALFRRPLNLPIPHTAIIPNNKDRIGESVANFLEHNFMTQQVLREELKQIDFAGVAAAWLAMPANRHAVSLQIVKGIPAFFRLVEDKDIGRFLQKAIAETLRNIKAAPMLGDVLQVLVVNGRHQLLFDHLIVWAADALERNRPLIRQKVHEKSPRWMPRVLDEKLYERILQEVQSILEEMKDEDSEWRMRFQIAMEDLIEKLKTSPEYQAKLENFIGQALNHPLFHDYVQQIWIDVKTRFVADAASPDSQAVAQLDNAARIFSDALTHDKTVQLKLNQWLLDFTVDAITRRRGDIANLIKRVIQKWDAETVSRKFELYVGKDLQYIRINGTIVGGLVGLILHTVSHFI